MGGVNRHRPQTQVSGQYGGGNILRKRVPQAFFYFRSFIERLVPCLISVRCPVGILPELFRQRLDSQWGIVDVDDCVNCARHLIEHGEVDGKRTVIRGGSAGGYTTLAALTFRDVFKAGASYFGVSDLEALANDTHKFESRYLDRIVGPYPSRRDLYLERSPIHYIERLSCPIIFFQGDEDRVVPPNQAEVMVNALRQKGIPVAYILFEGEQHGFRKAENIKRALDAELYFYSRISGFELAENVAPVVIDNLAIN